MAKKTITLEVIDGEITIHGFDRNAPEYRYWTLDETIKELLDVQSTDTKIFEARCKQFGQAITKEDGKLGRAIADELQLGLHPKNNLIDLMKIQLSGLV